MSLEHMQQNIDGMGKGTEYANLPLDFDAVLDKVSILDEQLTNKKGVQYVRKSIIMEVTITRGRGRDQQELQGDKVVQKYTPLHQKRLIVLAQSLGVKQSFQEIVGANIRFQQEQFSAGYPRWMPSVIIEQKAIDKPFVPPTQPKPGTVGTTQ